MALIQACSDLIYCANWNYLKKIDFILLLVLLDVI